MSVLYRHFEYPHNFEEVKMKYIAKTSNPQFLMKFQAITFYKNVITIIVTS